MSNDLDVMYTVADPGFVDEGQKMFAHEPLRLILKIRLADEATIVWNYFFHLKKLNQG